MSASFGSTGTKPSQLQSHCTDLIELYSHAWPPDHANELVRHPLDQSGCADTSGQQFSSDSFLPGMDCSVVNLLQVADNRSCSRIFGVAGQFCHIASFQYRCNGPVSGCNSSRREVKACHAYGAMNVRIRVGRGCRGLVYDRKLLVLEEVASEVSGVDNSNPMTQETALLQSSKRQPRDQDIVSTIRILATMFAPKQPCSEMRSAGQKISAQTPESTKYRK